LRTLDIKSKCRKIMRIDDIVYVCFLDRLWLDEFYHLDCNNFLDIF